MSAISGGEAKPAIGERLRGALRQWRPTAITLGAPVLPLGAVHRLASSCPLILVVNGGMTGEGGRDRGDPPGRSLAQP
jgi:hypothetical protein